MSYKLLLLLLTGRSLMHPVGLHYHNQVSVVQHLLALRLLVLVDLLMHAHVLGLLVNLVLLLLLLLVKLLLLLLLLLM